MVIGQILCREGAALIFLKFLFLYSTSNTENYCIYSNKCPLSLFMEKRLPNAVQNGLKTLEVGTFAHFLSQEHHL